jgi:hypothetical protein
MIRNENRPQWNNEVPLRLKIRETEPLGYVITDVINATDPDNVSRVNVETENINEEFLNL